MKKDAKMTEMVFVMDKSGSMSGLEDDTIGGFNSLISKQKEAKGDAVVTTVLFDSQIHLLHDGDDIKNIELMTEKDYLAGGCTALLDAVGTTISNVHMRQKKLKKKPDHTLFVIITDGMENASHEFSYSRVHEMISNRRKTSGWEFIFLGANIDAVKTADSIGIDESRAANYHADKKGTMVNFEAIEGALSNLRDNGMIKEDWKCSIEQDYKKRK